VITRANQFVIHVTLRATGGLGKSELSGIRLRFLPLVTVLPVHRTPLSATTRPIHHVRSSSTPPPPTLANPRNPFSLSLIVTVPLTTKPHTLPQRSAALKIEWAKISSSLGLKGQTAASLQAFKKRNEDARRKVVVLHDTPREIDFAHYRSLLKNQAVIDEIEAAFKSFKPKSYDVSKTIAAIESFEAAAVKNAETTKSKVDAELQDLSMTLKNISEARSFDELTVVRSE